MVSLMVSGRLWGLVSAHHYVPRFVHFEERAVCELLAEAVATRISALESFSQAQAELSVRRLEQRMIRAISSEGDWRGALFDGSRALLEAVEATGAALLFEDEVRTVGDVPSTLALREIGRWLDAQPRAAVMATASLGQDAPQFELLTAIASGLLATPVSTSPGEYLIWLRPERAQDKLRRRIVDARSHLASVEALGLRAETSGSTVHGAGYRRPPRGTDADPRRTCCCQPRWR